MSESTDAIAPGTVVAERYRVTRTLGEGGMGAVYEAANTITDKPVALKVLRGDVRTPEVKRRLLREARMAARVQHPHVIDIYDVGFDGDSMFLVMELLRGQPLDVWLAERAPVAPEELLVFVQQVLRGLGALHAQGIVHRDIKPANIFISETDNEPPRAKLLDLGIAQDRGSETITLTDPNQVMGTPAYMAPEQLERPDEVDARTDVYACGVVLYEALAGERPFQAANLTNLVTMVLTADPPPLAERRDDLPEGLSEVVARAMSRDPRDRHPDAASLAEALAPFGPAEAHVRVEREAEPAEKRGPGWGLWLGVAGLIVTAVMVASLFPWGDEQAADASSEEPVEPTEASEPGAELARPQDEPSAPTGPEPAVDADGTAPIPPTSAAEPAETNEANEVDDSDEGVAETREPPPRHRPRTRSGPSRTTDPPASERSEPAEREPPPSDPPSPRAPHLELDPDDF